mgnify:CR=1 FL=1
MSRSGASLVPEAPLDRGALEDARRLLEQMRLFQPGSVKVTVQPERPDEPPEGS